MKYNPNIEYGQIDEYSTGDPHFEDDITVDLEEFAIRSVAQSELKERIKSLLAQTPLTDTQKELLDLHFVHNVSLQAAGDALNLDGSRSAENLMGQTYRTLRAKATTSIVDIRDFL